MKLLVAIVLISVVQIALARTVNAAQYTITDLGQNLTPLRINAGGEVVGVTGNGGLPGFLYDGTMHLLGTFSPSDINDLGEISGTINNTATGPYQAAVYDNGSVQPIGPVNSVAAGMSNTGQVVGNLVNADDTIGAPFLYDGAFHDLSPILGATADATNINDSGEIAGSYGHAFVYDGTTVRFLPGTSIADDINASGQVVGTDFFSSISNSNRGFFYDGNTVHDLGTLGGRNSEAFGINNKGQIVGMSQSAGSFGNDHATLSTGQAWTDLNSLIDPTSGWLLTAAYGINDNGQIVGYGTLNGQAQEGFLLTPVPEPSSIALLAIGAIGLAAMARNQVGRLMKLSVAILLISVVQIPLARTASAAEYTITDLGASVQPWSINDSGEITGSTSGQAFLYDGTLNLLTTPGWASSGGNAINNSGEIAGTASPAHAGTPNQGFLYNGTVQYIVPSTPNSPASAINNIGQVVGYTDVSNTGVPFLYDGTLHDLTPVIGANTQPVAINDSGEIAFRASNNRSFLYDGTTTHDLGTFGHETYANSMNNSGEVVGESFVNGIHYHAFFYDGTIHDLGTLLGGSPSSADSQANGINNKGQIVGESDASALVQHAFLWTAGQGMVDLNSLIDPTSGWLLGYATAINDNGQIVGTGSFNGHNEGYLLTPVPEPSSIALLTFGAIGLAAMARHRRG